MKGELLELKSTDMSVPKEDTAEEEKEVEEKPLAENLPKLNVQKFSGEPIDWLQFQSLYSTEVHTKADLTNSQKFNALKSLLSDELFKLIEHFYSSSSETAYEEAWKLLENKFCKKTLIDAYLEKLIQQPNVNGLSLSIFKLLDETIKYLHGLQTLNVDTKNWDILLVHILVQKLTEKLKTEWKKTHTSNELPTLYDFLKFLNSKHQKIDLSDEIEKFNYTANLNDFGCLYCKGKHPLWRCDKFESMSIDERLIFVKNKKACVRCLSSKHTFSECDRKYTCRICQSKQHHYILHKNSKRNQS
ncbi:uncharacterized protein LOC129910234 [Episyrphus balteatus]|uniref:uncharacterized protein LOC129910234 n=1 Tax=Episyrphus balteatus TaxID=286459 RepID=UPI002484E754|nr:uncharacterized protein LOC129910234 [Episyrphus balteatus]